MGKRAAATPPGHSQPVAKARASLQAAFARAAKDQVTPDIFTLDYEGWKLAVINQSRQYYAQRTDGWMRALWIKTKGAAGHTLAGAFLQDTWHVPTEKTPWVYNPKETYTAFEAYLDEKNAVGMAQTSVGPAVDQTATSAVVGSEPRPTPEHVEKDVGTASDAQPIDHDSSKPEKSEPEMTDASASAKPIEQNDTAASAKPEAAEQEMVDAAASAESKGDTADSARPDAAASAESQGDMAPSVKPEEAKQEMVDAAASAELKGDMAASVKPEEAKQEMVDAAASAESKDDMAASVKPDEANEEMVDAAASAESKGDMAASVKPEEAKMVDAAATAESIEQKSDMDMDLELKGSASAAAFGAAGSDQPAQTAPIGGGDDQVKLDRLVVDAVAACMQNEHLASHIETLREDEALGAEDWTFADRDGDQLSDLFTFREWLEDRKLEVPSPLAAALDLWEELEEKRLSACHREEQAAPALNEADSKEGLIHDVWV